jgi:bis(5'-nucleosidyl)-tetraphosphatase
MTKMIEELSAGAVIFHENSNSLGRKYLVLNYPAGHWDFPKGAVEQGETEQQAAIREIKEETGIQIANFIPGFRKNIEYHYRRRGGLSHKRVVFFLAKSSTDQVQISFEHSGYDWITIEEAINRLTFENARKVLRDADDFLSRMSFERGSA